MVMIAFQAKLKERDVFHGEETTLRRVIKEMGFKHKTINDKLHYYEQPRIIEQRHKYLRRMRKNRTEKRPVVYLDETWCNAHDGKGKAWVTSDGVTASGTKGGVK